ncbi:DUF4395 domain-containing protein [Arthrobacter sp. N199823]|uniref:DUF4395 domain-containing protein n=1 Tax=Arthrobacter sp. N199823 TaxID=2058895 RepID=UPI000CE2FA25|nr:DUF4395 domain-containing protein [Arthrobacter sp. N199823]
MSQLADIPAATEFIQPEFTVQESVPPAEAGLLKRIFAFPNPVNEYAARCTAGLVVVMALVAILTQWEWLVGIIAAGFILRLAFGPRISPAALLSVKVLAPRLGQPKLVPGPPKRFAQGIGVVMSVTAFILLLVNVPLAGWALMALLLVAASLESFIGLCLGCILFGVLVRRGLIPAGICDECANVNFRSR